MSTQTTSLSDVTPEDAYAAARDRALRTADALIGAEAQVRSLTRRLDEQIAANRKLAEDNERLTRSEENHWMPSDAGPVEWTCVTPQQCKGGEQHAEESSDPPGYLAAVGQAD